MRSSVVGDFGVFGVFGGLGLGGDIGALAVARPGNGGLAPPIGGNARIISGTISPSSFPFPVASESGVVVASRAVSNLALAVAAANAAALAAIPPTPDPAPPPSP